eukprot:scaffold47068_cov63-Phaeocystis_antarctica.AAC.6
MLRNGVRRSHGQDRTRTCLHAHVPSVLAMTETVGRFSDEVNFGHNSRSSLVDRGGSRSACCRLRWGVYASNFRAG